MESRRLATEALEKDIGLEKGNIFPSLSVAGGYKNVEDEFTGFVIGLSMPIPVLNRNSGESTGPRPNTERRRRNSTCTRPPGKGTCRD